MSDHPNLQSIVLLLKFPAEFLELFLESSCLCEVCSGMISLFLQLITPFLVLLILSLQTLHISEKLRDPSLQRIDPLQLIHFDGEVVQLSSIFSTFSFFNINSQ